MKTTLFIFFQLLFFKAVFAQTNLVPNGSFELFDTCPDNEGQISRAIGWSNYGVYNSTPDYYNACDTGIVNVPNGSLGVTQNAHTGNAFAAIITDYLFNSYREYVGIQLSQPLTIGTKYYLSFYASLGESKGRSCPTNNMGMLLSTVPYSIANPISIINFSHLKSDSIISDTLNWTHVSGSILADSAYDYLVIGNLYSNVNTDTLNWGPLHTLGYYGIDDICISTDSLVCTTVSAISELPHNTINIFPNPFQSTLCISLNVENNFTVFIYDLTGTLKLLRKYCNQSNVILNLEWLASGCYLLEITNNENKIIARKKTLKF